MTGSERTLKVAVFGAAGYAGGELLRLLLTHPSVDALRAFSSSHAGVPAGELHPAVGHLSALQFEEPALREGSHWADVVFLALPHGNSQEVIDEVLAEDPRLVVDLAADFRLREMSLYREYYGEHGREELVESFSYALADLEGSSLRGARRLAAPGCFATACLLAAGPLARAGLLGEPPLCFAVTGSTGSGAQVKRTTHHPVRANNFFAYAAAGHRHEAEVIAQLREWSGSAAASLRLMVHSAPLVRGIHLTLHARLARPLEGAAAFYAAAYEGRPFVHLRSSPPELAAVVGTNHAHLHASLRDQALPGGPEGGRELICYVAIDNLVKGAAGQAVQGMNLSLGLEEDSGLGFGGLYPC